MRTLSTRTWKLLGAATAVTLVVAACQRDLTPPQEPAISRAEAEQLAQVVASDLASLPEGAVYLDPLGMPFDMLPLSTAPRDAAGAFFGCAPTRTPEVPQDSDGDRVPDFVRLDFDCTITTDRGTFTLTGAIEISDPTPTTADHSIQSVYIDLTRSATSFETGGTTTWVLNGTRLASASSTVLSHQLIDFRTDVTFPDGSTASHEKDWLTTFTADPGSSISPRQPLPSGTWNIEGTSSWSRGDHSASYSVSTDPDLHYNAACTVAPKFDSGKITLTRTRGDRTVTVTIEFTACGQYTVTRS